MNWYFRHIKLVNDLGIFILQEYVNYIAAKFGWDRIFDGIWSYDTFGTKYSKPDLMAKLLGELGVDPADAVMVGDTAGDVDTGRRNSMMTVAVAYGYGSRGELSGADVICESTAELVSLVS